MWKATLLLQWLHDEDAIAGYNTLRIIPLLEAFKGAKWKDFFLALDWRWFAFYGQNSDCVALSPSSI